MKLQACFPCVLAFGILLPLVALSFVTWFLFYDRAVDLAQESGDFYLNRITAIMSERIQEVLVRTDNIAFTARTSLANFLPWALIPNATIVDKPNLLMHLNLLTDLTPSYVYGVVCATEGGVAFTILQRARDQWSFFLIQDGLTTAPQMIRFYLNTSDPIALAKALFKSNATWLDIRDHPNIVIDSTPALFLYRSRDWYVEARTKYAEGIYSGWSKSYPIIGGLYGGGLGMAAWFGLSGDSETPFVGMCHSQLFLGDLHTVLSANKLGVNGLAILTDASGIVIATSRDMDAGGGVGRTGVPTNICDVADFTTPCLRLQELLATQTPDILVPSTAAAAAAKPFASTSVELRTSTFDGDVRYSVFSIRARAFSGYLVFVGRAADFNGGIDHDRNVAVVVSVAVLLVVSSCVAFVTYLFSRPLSVVSSMLREISHVSSEHSRKLEQDGVLQSLPDREWERITRLVDSYVSATPTDDAPVGRPRSRCHPWTKCCDRMMVGRWGGPELKQLQGSLLTMVDSLSNLARKATEQEVLRRKFIRYIFHEVAFVCLLC